jgi:hypothetical protein
VLRAFLFHQRLRNQGAVLRSVWQHLPGAYALSPLDDPGALATSPRALRPCVHLSLTGQACQVHRITVAVQQAPRFRESVHAFLPKTS